MSIPALPGKTAFKAKNATTLIARIYPNKRQGSASQGCSIKSSEGRLLGSGTEYLPRYWFRRSGISRSDNSRADIGLLPEVYIRLFAR